MDSGRLGYIFEGCEPVALGQGHVGGKSWGVTVGKSCRAGKLVWPINYPQQGVYKHILSNFFQGSPENISNITLFLKLPENSYMYIM